MRDEPAFIVNGRAWSSLFLRFLPVTIHESSSLVVGVFCFPPFCRKDRPAVLAFRIFEAHDDETGVFSLTNNHVIPQSTLYSPNGTRVSARHRVIARPFKVRLSTVFLECLSDTIEQSPLSLVEEEVHDFGFFLHTVLLAVDVRLRLPVAIRFPDLFKHFADSLLSPRNERKRKQHGCTQ